MGRAAILQKKMETQSGGREGSTPRTRPRPKRERCSPRQRVSNADAFKLQQNQKEIPKLMKSHPFNFCSRKTKIIIIINDPPPWAMGSLMIIIIFVFLEQKLK